MNNPDEQPIEGEIFGPGEQLPVPNQPTDGKKRPGRRGGKKIKATASTDGDGKPDAKKPHPSMRGGKGGFGRQRPPEEVEEENKASSAFHALVAAGGFDWRYADWEPTKAQRDTVIMLKFSGYNDEDIATATNMSVESLQRYFPQELKSAKMLIIGDLASRAVHRARNGNDVLLMFLLKTRSGGNFSERVAAVEALAGDGSPEGITDARKKEIVNALSSLFTDRKKTKKDKDEETT